MAYTNIDKSSLHFNTKTYTGNGSTNALTGINHQPDLVWCKKRNSAQDHGLCDSVRGVTKVLYPNSTTQASTDANSVTAFGTDGFTLGSSGDFNQNSDTYVAWCWKAGGSASSNSNGSITSSVSVNTTAGISIVAYTGTGSAGATVGHGLGVKPSLIIEKGRAGVTDDWLIYHPTGTATHGYALNNSTAATDSDSYWNDVEPTSTVFTIGNNGKVNTNGATHIAYCFAEKKGFSKFGAYTGNGNTDGQFLYCGFKPAFVVYKKSSDTGDWQIFDNKRDGYNNDNDYLQANANLAEQTTDIISLVSNGFKVIGDNSNGWNKDGSTYIWWAFAEAPLVGSNNEPCKAR